MANPGPVKVTVSVRVKPENLTKIDRIAAAHKWTRSQAMDELIEADDKLDKPPRPPKDKK